jgi:hypothetical protein
MWLSATPSLQLEWRGAPECPTRDAFLADVRRLRGAVLETSAEGAVLVEVTLAPAQTRWRASVATRSRGGEGRRELDADTCAEVVAAAAVVVSLALADPDAPPPGEPAAPAPLTPAPVEPEREATIALGLTGGVRAGPLPAVAPGASLAAVLTFDAFRFELAGSTPFLARVEKNGAAAQLAWWVNVRLAACYEFSLGRLVLAPCVLGHGGWLAGRGEGGAATSSGGGALAVISGGLLARLRLFSHLWLRFDGSGGVALARPRFITTTDGSTSVLAESAPWLLDANLGFEWRFD